MVDSTRLERADRAEQRSQIKIVVPDDHSMVSLLGSRDELLHVIERAFRSDIHVRGNEITVTGAAWETELVSRLFSELIELLQGGTTLTPDAVERSLAMLRSQTEERPAEVLTLDVLSSRGRTIRPKTLNQKRYVDAIDKHTIVFGIGPAGTGKTYLAMAKAVRALQDKQVNRIILTRPAVEAGERLGFLPGTLYEKIDPYLRPLYDALHDMVDPDSIPRLMAAGTIEVAPLAYMRGRAQPVHAAVMTPSGWRPIGELQVGDLVIGSDGEPTPVLGVYPQGEKEIFRLTADDGASTLCTADHLWTVAVRGDGRAGGPPRVLETREIIEGLRAGRAYELPLLSRPLAFPARDLPADPYALGLLLAEGRPADAAVPAARPRAGAGRAVGLAGAPGPVATLEQPVAAIAHGPEPSVADPAVGAVPEAYLYNAALYNTALYNTAEVRLAVLQGLLDAGGDPVVRQDGTGAVRYPAPSERLRDDVLFLVRSLGGVAFPARTGAAARHGHDAHILDIRLPEGVEPFRLERKRDAYRAAAGARPTRFIDAIEPVGSAEAVCIQVAAADSLYVTEDFLLTHNTLNDSFIILDEAQNTTPEQMKMFLTRLGFGSKVVVTGDVTQVDLPGGQQSGLRVVQEILDGIDDIHFCRLTSHDVVRHKLVTEIVDAYNRYDESRLSGIDKGAAERGTSRKRRR
ncbi:hypothetical protein Arub01_10740 [Actinomadura rubrobrunea]|uniref:PhoH-like protein n=1 Tax=Actinomadura rubrobrunea TaxID=115335 RepID=A0A9W6PQV5_9ACTN|nr:hypothetical protein Arub01_10740 [Actinomadura rubrobrunea]